MRLFTEYNEACLGRDTTGGFIDALYHRRVR